MAFKSEDPAFRDLTDDQEIAERTAARLNPPNLATWESFHPVWREEWLKQGLEEGVSYEIWRVDGTRQRICGRRPDLSDMQEAVGGHIELVAVPGNDNMYMVVNEEGQIKGFPHNPGASQVAGQPILGTVLWIERKFIQ